MTTRYRTRDCAEAPASPRTRRAPWLFIVGAIVVVISILGGESWAIRHTPAVDGSVSATVASDLNRVLARVAETSLLIGPMD
jgi:hypothetical protein